MVLRNLENCMRQEHSITFIMPVYNAQKTLLKSVQSLLCQTCDNWKLICIDDGSTDKSASIIQKIKDHRITYIKQENSGPAVARANGIKCVNSQYVAILDADDFVSPDYVEKILSTANKTKADIIVPNVKNVKGDVYEESNHFDRHHLTVNSNKEYKDCEERFLLAFSWAFHGWLVARTNLIQNIYIKSDVNYSRFNSDEYITRKLYYNANQGVALCDTFYFYTYNDDSLTHTVSEKYFDRILTYQRLISFANTEHLSQHACVEVMKQYRSCLLSLIELNEKKFNKEKTLFLRNTYRDYRKNITFKLLCNTTIVEIAIFCATLLGFNLIRRIVMITR